MSFPDLLPPPPRARKPNPGENIMNVPLAPRPEQKDDTTLQAETEARRLPFEEEVFYANAVIERDCVAALCEALDEIIVPETDQTRRLGHIHAQSQLLFLLTFRPLATLSAVGARYRQFFVSGDLFVLASQYVNLKFSVINVDLATKLLAFFRGFVDSSAKLSLSAWQQRVVQPEPRPPPATIVTQSAEPRARPPTIVKFSSPWDAAADLR